VLSAGSFELEQSQEELLDGAGLGDLGWSITAAYGDEVGELVEDLASACLADPL
jgi:hypothetical protein